MRNILIVAVKFILSALLLYLAIQKTDFAELRSRMDSASISWLVLAVMVALFQTFLAAIRWRKIGLQCNAFLTNAQAIRLSLIGMFFNQTLPSSVGGDAVRLWIVARITGWRAATYSVLIDRIVGLIALAVLVVVSLPWSFALFGDNDGRAALLLVDLAALSGSLCFLLLGLLPQSLVGSWRPIRHLHACSIISNRAMWSRIGGPMLWSLAMSNHVLTVIIAWCIARSIAASVTFDQLLLMIPPVMLITMLPLSIAGWGLREASMGLAFGYGGLISYQGVHISLLFGGVYFVVGVFGGVVWLVSKEQRAQR